MEAQRRNSQSKGRAGAGRTPSCVDKQKANGFILGIQEMVTDEIQVKSYVDLQLGSAEGGKKQ